MNQSNIKGIIFDYGGTLDSYGDHWSHIIYKAYLNAGLEIEIPIFREAYVYAERELARTRHILPEHDFHDLMKIKIRIELQFLVEKGHFNPDRIDTATESIASFCYDYARSCVNEAIPVIRRLHEKYPIVLVSNFYGNISSVLKDFGLSDCFDKIIESSVVGVRKPDPQIFMMGADTLNLKPEEILVIGDSYKKDILPARSIGCHTLWLKGKGWTAEEDAVTDPDIISTISELENILL